MQPIRRIVGFVLVLGLGACAGDAQESGEAHVEVTRDVEESDDVEASGVGDAPVVEARNIAFPPETLTVEAGARVVFVNEDVVRHTVTAGEPGEADGTFDEDLSGQGDVVEIDFDEAGTFVYHCDLHRNMTGEVVVE
jgi:plastocyanin